MNIRIIGAGLIGTSIGLGLLRAGHHICFSDSSLQNLAIAEDLLGDVSHFESADVVVIATPLGVVFETLKSEFQHNSQATFIDIAGLKSELISNVEGFPALAKRFCGTHPMAGREISGPTGARGDLFQGATWIITPTSFTDAAAVGTAKLIIQSLGAVVKEVKATEHDRAISSVSHLPQVLSTLLASRINEINVDDISLAGQGLRDLTRLADSNPNLWTDLLIANSEFVLADIESLQEKLSTLVKALKANDSESIRKIFVSGNQGKSKIPGKHGKPSRDYSYLPIVIDDKPGQLAAIFDECAKVSVNIEDLFIEHSPGQETGLITLALSSDDATVLQQHLVKQNWRVHDIRVQR